MENLSSASRCAACGAQLRQAQNLFDFEEGRAYPPPTETFDTENLAQLKMAVEEWLDGEDDSQIRFWLKHIRKHFEEFTGHGMAQLARALEVEKRLNSAGDFHHHVGYLVSKGVALCEEGLAGMESALGVEDEHELQRLLDVFRQGNDHICTALLMISERQEMLDEAVQRFAPEDDQSEAP
ncbi:hypothetical protein JST97_13635 [bacterium]|nr:hypothetical protein [bacterium]